MIAGVDEIVIKYLQWEESEAEWKFLNNKRTTEGGIVAIFLCRLYTFASNGLGDPVFEL